MPAMTEGKENSVDHARENGKQMRIDSGEPSDSAGHVGLSDPWPVRILTQKEVMMQRRAT